MSLSSETLELRLSGSYHGLSARRLLEHTELGQINVFKQGISARRELNDATTFIDVVCFFDKEFSLAGFTLAELKAGNCPVYIAATGETVAPALAGFAGGSGFFASSRGPSSVVFNSLGRPQPAPTVSPGYRKAQCLRSPVPVQHFAASPARPGEYQSRN